MYLNDYPYLRETYIRTIKQKYYEALNRKAFLALHGESGTGKLDSVRYFLDKYVHNRKCVISNGNYIINGYFAGFYDFFEIVFEDVSSNYSELIARHEQTIKRFFPFIDSTLYSVPKDLTNSATPDERTRFYHHEYQEKLLNGIYEFFLDYCKTSKKEFTLIIDGSDSLSKTVKSFLSIMTNRKELSNYLGIILIYDNKIDFNISENCVNLFLEDLTFSEAKDMLKNTNISNSQINIMVKLAVGNISKLLTLKKIKAAGLPIIDFLSFDTYIDFYLNQQGETFRYNLLKDYINNHCVSDDFIAVRNYDTSPLSLKDILHKQLINDMKTDKKRYIFTLIHHMRLSSEKEQIVELAPIAIKLQEIGVYDTWFDLFSKYYIDKDLRSMANGDELHNAVFVRMAFILYSLGMSQMSIPYLDFFYENFPESKQTPMILYSQAMTYGRYRVPVDLEKAEKYALKNLESIDTIFNNHPKYVYIKVFAENALAYIRAKQGRLQEAVSLCTEGLDKMKEIYGEEKYALHQSILVYNTGQVYEILKDFDKAEKMYKHSIRLDPYYGEYYNDLANLYFNYGHFKDALNYYQKAIDLCPPYYEAHANRARAFEELGKLEDAISDYSRAIVLKPNSIHLRNNLALLYYENEQYQEGLDIINQAILINDEDHDLFNTRGLLHQELKNIELAKNDFIKATLLKPNYSEGYNNLAVLEFSLNNLDESMNLLDTAISLNSNDPDFYINKATLYKNMGQFDRAKVELKKAEKLKVIQ